MTEYCIYTGSFPISIQGHSNVTINQLKLVSKLNDTNQFFNARLVNTGNPKYMQLNVERNAVNSDYLDKLETLGVIYRIRKIVVSQDSRGMTNTETSYFKDVPNDYYSVRLSS